MATLASTVSTRTPRNSRWATAKNLLHFGAVLSAYGAYFGISFLWGQARRATGPWLN
jgi:hypothetical protein